MREKNENKKVLVMNEKDKDVQLFSFELLKYLFNFVDPIIKFCRLSLPVC